MERANSEGGVLSTVVVAEEINPPVWGEIAGAGILGTEWTTVLQLELPEQCICVASDRAEDRFVPYAHARWCTAWRGVR